MTNKLAVTPLLELIAGQAGAADQTRSVSADVVDAIKSNPIMSFTASKNIGGQAATMERIGRELEAVAASCGSTGWVLWNHLCTFHLFAGMLGPSQSLFLERIVSRGEWVCFPAGASTGVKGIPSNEEFRLEGKAAFGSGGRYAEWAGVSFVVDDRRAPQFVMVRLDQEQVEIDADWRAMTN